jgi:hypothetical protein
MMDAPCPGPRKPRHDVVPFIDETVHPLLRQSETERLHAAEHTSRGADRASERLGRCVD